MRLPLFFDFHFEDRSIVDTFNLGQEIIKAIPAGIFAVAASYIAVVLTFKKDKTRERNKIAHEKQQTFDYLKMTMEKAYKDIYTQLVYLNDYRKQLKRRPAEEHYPTVDGRHYLDVFAKELDKKVFYFSLNDEGRLDSSQIGNIQSSFLYIHNVYNELYKIEIPHRIKLDHERRIRFQSLDLALRKILTTSSIDSSIPTDQAFSMMALNKFYDFARDYGYESLEDRVQILYQGILNELRDADVTASFRQNVLNQIHEIVEVYSNIKYNHTAFSNFLGDYFLELIKAKKLLKRNCKNLDGFIFTK